MNCNQKLKVEKDIKLKPQLKLESIKEEKIDCPEIKAEPLDINEEPLDIKEEPLDIKEEPLESTNSENVRKRKDCDKNGKHSNWKSFKSSKEMYGIHSEETTISTVHEKKKRYNCSVCDAPFDSKFQMRKHRFYVHVLYEEEKRIPNKQFECSICKKGFGKKKSLKKHNWNFHAQKSSM